jgi:2-oxoglutarate ferredoxin oxidoreductase subunit gamma
MSDELAVSDRVEVRLSGSGGQGVLLAATILAEAATVLGKHVVQTQSYGPAARGGASKAEVVVSSDEIDYPEVRTPHASLCLSQEAYDKYAGDTRAGGLLVYDAGQVDPGVRRRSFRMCGIPFAQVSAERLGNTVVANIVAVGALTALTGLLPAEGVEAAVVRRVPERFRDLNRQAFRLGVELAAGCDGGEPVGVDAAAGGARESAALPDDGSTVG